MLHTFDACAYGSPHYKPTSWLTNGPSGGQIQRPCPGLSRSHKHDPLKGQVWDPKKKQMVWKIKAAQEYSLDLCRTAAKIYAADLAQQLPAPVAATAAPASLLPVASAELATEQAPEAAPPTLARLE